MAVFMASTSYLFREPDPIILRGDQKPGFQITTDEENADGIEIPVWQDDSNCNNHSTRLEDGDEEGAVTGAVTEEVTSDGVLIEKCNDIPNQLSSKHENESIPVTETGDSVGIDSECCMDAEEKHT